MNLVSPKIAQDLLERYNIRPRQRLGQNFLIDRNILNKIIAASDLSKQDTVVEVGPGIGVLTQELASRVKKVIAIEKDKKMCEILKEVLKDFENIEILNEDILKWGIREIPLNPPLRKGETDSIPPLKKGVGGFNDRQVNFSYKVVANLPYYITSSVIRRFLESASPPDSMVLMVQKEVGERVIAGPPNMSILSVAVQFYAQPKIIAKVSKNCFWPAPRVDSVIIKIVKNDQYTRITKGNEKKFFKIVKAGFSSKRKQLLGNIIRSFNIPRQLVQNIFKKINLDNKIRAQELTVPQWIALLQEIKDMI